MGQIMANGNNETLRKWIGTLLPVALLIISIIIWGQNLSAGIAMVSTALEQHVETDSIREAGQERALAELEKKGSLLSHSNEKRIIKIEGDVLYTKEAVKRIEAIVRELAKRKE